MASLQIKTGQVSLTILDDQGEERGIFKFNPNDLESARQVLKLQQELHERNEEFNKRSLTCETADEKVDLLNEIVDYFRGLIDQCFGEGSSQTLFGDAKTLSMFDDFFTGIQPYYEKASEQRMQKYGVASGK